MAYKSTDEEGTELEAFNTPSKVRDLIDAIRKLESADGKLLNHKTIQSGEQKGMKAVGEYGLTPVGYFDALRVLGEREKNPEFKHLGSIVKKNSKVPVADKQMLMENLMKARPELEQKIIRDLANRLLVRQQGDVGKAAVAYEGNPYQALISDEVAAVSPRLERLKSQYNKDLFPKSPENKEADILTALQENEEDLEDLPFLK